MAIGINSKAAAADKTLESQSAAQPCYPGSYPSSHFTSSYTDEATSYSCNERGRNAYGFHPELSMSGFCRNVNLASSLLNPPMPIRLESVEATLDTCEIPDRPHALIEDLLRKNGKFLITGPSKGGKSFLAIQIFHAVATGGKWLGFECDQGKVVYVNQEIDDIEFRHRVAKVGNAIGADSELVKRNGDIIIRPRQSFNMEDLVSGLIDKYSNDPTALIIIDPIYMLVDGDENSSSAMRLFCGQLDRLILMLGCSVVAIHHHSKGNQSGKAAIDKASGSGILGRSFDAIVAVDYVSASDKHAMVAEFELRDYPKHSPVYYTFDGTCCQVDLTGKVAALDNSLSRKAISLKARLLNLETVCEKLIQGKSFFDRKELIKELGWAKDTVDSFLDRSTKFTRESGNNWCHVVRTK